MGPRSMNPVVTETEPANAWPDGTRRTIARSARGGPARRRMVVFMSKLLVKPGWRSRKSELAFRCCAVRLTIQRGTRASLQRGCLDGTRRVAGLGGTVSERLRDGR